jgi:hypothetical protein
MLAVVKRIEICIAIPKTPVKNLTAFLEKFISCFETRGNGGLWHGTPHTRAGLGS